MLFFTTDSIVYCGNQNCTKLLCPTIKIVSCSYNVEHRNLIIHSAPFVVTLPKTTVN